MEVKQVQHKLTEDDRALAEIFNTKSGEKALEYLKILFYNLSPMTNIDNPKDGPYNHSDVVLYKVGRADVIRFIEETLDMYKKGI